MKRLLSMNVNTYPYKRVFVYFTIHLNQFESLYLNITQAWDDVYKGRDFESVDGCVACLILIGVNCNQLLLGLCKTEEI